MRLGIFAALAAAVSVSMSGCSTTISHQQMAAEEMPFGYDAPEGSDVAHEQFRNPRNGVTFFTTDASTDTTFTLVAKVETPSGMVILKRPPADQADDYFHQGSITWKGAETTRGSNLGEINVQPYRIDNDNTACVALQRLDRRTFDDSRREIYNELFIAVYCHEGAEPVSSAETNDLLNRISLRSS